MKYLVVEIRKDGLDIETRLPILEDGWKKYESAKKDERNDGVYLTAILKEIDLTGPNPPAPGGSE